MTASLASRAGLARPALARCIRVDAATFAADYWDQQPLLSRAADLPGAFTDLLTLDDVDELVSRRGLRTPFLRIAKNGTVIDTSRFTAGGGAGAEIGDQVSDDAVLDLFLDGASLVLQGLHRLWPPVVELVSALSAELGHPAQANAYITPAQSRGFDAHYDVHDVFVLQLAGTKRWTIHSPVLSSPLRDQPWSERAADVAARAEQAPYLETVLHPGDALYLPRGWLHAAEALGDVSAHLTVGVHPVTRWSLVEAVTALAVSDPALRTSLPVGVDVADPSSLAEDLAATLDALAAHLRAGEVDAAAVATRLRRSVWGGSRPTPLSPLRQAAGVRGLQPDTVVRLRAGLRIRLETDPGDADRVRLLLRGRWLGFPGTSGTALRVLLEGRDSAAGELSGLSSEDSLALSRRLLREAVLVCDQVGAQNHPAN